MNLLLGPCSNQNSIFWANSGLGVVTLPDFWSTIHAGNVRVIRDSVDLVDRDTVYLTNGESFSVDYMVMCTGWGDHFSMFDKETKADLGIPTLGDTTHWTDEPAADNNWEKYDLEADKTVNEKLPFLASPPNFTSRGTNMSQAPKRWRLYRRSIPLSLAERGDRSLAIMGQIHTVQTPLVSEMQSFWSILYLLGELDLPDYDTMAREIAEWNAWTRKRYLGQGQKFPYSLYDFLPVRLPPPCTYNYESPSFLISLAIKYKSKLTSSTSTSTPFAKTSASTRSAKRASSPNSSHRTSPRILTVSSMSIYLRRGICTCRLLFKLKARGGVRLHVTVVVR